MVATLLTFLFGCRHARETWPLKPRNRRGQVMRQLPSYVACIDCGRERDYTLLDVTAGPAFPIEVDRETETA